MHRLECMEGRMDVWLGGCMGGCVGGTCGVHRTCPPAFVQLDPPGTSKPSNHPPPSPRFKVNLLTSLPLARGFLRGDWFPEKLNHGFTKYAFAVVSALQRD